MVIAKRSKNNLKGQFKKDSQPVFLEIPATINIYDEFYRGELLKIISKLHRHSKKGTHKVVLDFRKTTHIYSNAMIFLYAEIRNIKSINPNLELKCIKPKDSRAAHVLHQIGLYKIFNVSFSPNKQFSDVIFWRVCYGIGIIGERYDTVVDVHENIPPEIDLYGGCIEATKTQ